MRLPSLRSVADATLIVAAVMVTLAAGQLYFQTPSRSAAAPQVIEPKQRVQLKNVDFKQSRRTLLLVLSSKCPYCEKSMPFYERMIAKKSTDARVVVVGGEDEKVLQNYLTLHDIAVDAVARVDRQATPSQLTPTAILVDSEGIVTKVCKGQLSPDAESEVMQLMSR